MKRAGENWLSLTPEPELELPAAVVTLRAGAPAGDEAVARERSRAQRLVVRASRRRWERWLADARDLAHSPAPTKPDVSVEAARAAALDVISNHDALRLGLTKRTGRGGRGGRGR